MVLQKPKVGEKQHTNFDVNSKNETTFSTNILEENIALKIENFKKFLPISVSLLHVQASRRSLSATQALADTHSSCHRCQKGRQRVSLLHGCSQLGVGPQSSPRRKRISPPSPMNDEACDPKFTAAQSHTKNAERRGDGAGRGARLVRQADVMRAGVTEEGGLGGNIELVELVSELCTASTDPWITHRLDSLAAKV